MERNTRPGGCVSSVDPLTASAPRKPPGPAGGGCWATVSTCPSVLSSSSGQRPSSAGSGPGLPRALSSGRRAPSLPRAVEAPAPPSFGLGLWPLESLWHRRSCPVGAHADLGSRPRTGQALGPRGSAELRERGRSLGGHLRPETPPTPAPRLRGGRLRGGSEGRRGAGPGIRQRNKETGLCAATPPCPRPRPSPRPRPLPRPGRALAPGRAQSWPSPSPVH